jgi:hypothetical protein
VKPDNRNAALVDDVTPKAAARGLNNPAMTLIQAPRAEDAFRDFRI